MAFFFSNSNLPLPVTDQATSALDSNSERQVQEAMQVPRRGETWREWSDMGPRYSMDFFRFLERVVVGGSIFPLVYQVYIAFSGV